MIYANLGGYQSEGRAINVSHLRVIAGAYLIPNQTGTELQSLREKPTRGRRLLLAEKFTVLSSADLQVQTAMFLAFGKRGNPFSQR